MDTENKLIKAATFNPKVKTYIFLVVLFYLCVSFIGLILVPFWLLGLGQFISGKFFKTLKCELTEKNLRFAKGIIFHIEKTIPLENIQDLSFFGGPILRAFGLTMIRVETAGGGGGHNSNMMSMIGIEGAEEFKLMILSQREKRIREKDKGFPSEQITTTNAIQSNPDVVNLLRDIKEELTEIKNTLKEKK
jgi:putative membrane protein